MKKNILVVVIFILSFYFLFNESFHCKLARVEEAESIICNLNSTSFVTTQNEESIYYKVKFKLNGGSYDGNTEDFEETYLENSFIVCPDESKMEREYTKFRGWYTEDNVAWDFDNDVIISDMVLIANWKWQAYDSINSTEKEPFNTVSNYLSTKYYNTSNFMISEHTTKDISGENILEMLSSKYPKSEILKAIEITQVKSSYGGCGPIAMMGVLHYLSSALGYSEIIDNPQDSNQRISLACDVLKEVGTYEIMTNTLTLPNDYVSAFNNLMKNYDLNQYIKATNNGFFTSYKDDIRKIKESIDNGLPVTLYVTFLEPRTSNLQSKSTDKGELDQHYVNIYGYQDWSIKDKDGNFTSNTIFLYRQNWGEDYLHYVDADILLESITGIITYDILKYDNTEILTSSDFSTEFINKETNQGQYFFDIKTAPISSTNGYVFQTERLRCSFIENEYLVLSANRKGAGLAYLEFKLPDKLKKITFDMSLWSAFENLDGGDNIRIEYRNEGEESWNFLVCFDSKKLSTVKLNPKNYTVLFPKNISDFRFCVLKSNPTADRNKGRVVLNNIQFFYNNSQNEPHYHKFSYVSIDRNSHKIVCNGCEFELRKPHIISSADYDKPEIRCIQCGGLVYSHPILSIQPIKTAYRKEDDI